jgi:hypothetical protein
MLQYIGNRLHRLISVFVELGISNLILPFLINKLSAHHYLLRMAIAPTGSLGHSGSCSGVSTQTIAKAN